MAKSVDFYFDFSSSYSYVALPEIERLAHEHEVSIDWKPILLGVIFQSLGHAPADPRTPKGRYIKRDVERAAALAGLVYRWPRPFPFNSLLAARVFWCLAERGHNEAVEWARSVFDASFGEGRDASSAEVLADVATSLGHDAGALLEGAAAAPVKQKLREVTDEAMERGVFGAPTFFVGDEMFWGSDRVRAIAGSLAARQA